jgi:hypothetical protein
MWGYNPPTIEWVDWPLLVSRVFLVLMMSRRTDVGTNQIIEDTNTIKGLYGYLKALCCYLMVHQFWQGLNSSIFIETVCTMRFLHLLPVWLLAHSVIAATSPQCKCVRPLAFLEVKVKCDC